MKESIATSGLIMNEPLLWEKGKTGRTAFSIPKQDVEPAVLDASIAGEGPDFPDLSELDVVRHFTRLSTWNFGVDTGLYPLGSCTMKYNPKINEKAVSIPGFANAHPMLPEQLSQGALKVIYELEQFLTEITDMDATSVQPAAGAHGELAGMLIIAAWHRSKGSKRTKVLVPDSAHGTNPASASLCGYKSIPVKSSDEGIISVDAVAELMDEETAGIMITNPNTLGIFEENIRRITDIVHSKGGLVYGDGANMNAVMGIASIKNIGIDVIHLNLHKTFSTPHGGGGPGSGPICVRKELEPFLPVPRVVKKEDDTFELITDTPETIGKMHAFHGNFGVMLRAYSYILSLGAENIKKVSQLAVLNANYIKEKLKDVYHLAFDKPCMHECVFTDKIQNQYKVSTLDIAKRLMDYGFHPPTIYFPLVVSGAMMIEPTETESKENIEQFIDAMKQIAVEASETPEVLHNTPNLCKVKRMDETGAARNPCLTGC